MNVDLTPSEAQYLSVLAAQDIRSDTGRGFTVRSWHVSAWEKLQDACEWERDTVADGA